MNSKTEALTDKSRVKWRKYRLP